MITVAERFRRRWERERERRKLAELGECVAMLLVIYGASQIARAG